MDITLTSIETEHSRALYDKIAQNIANNGGWIPFSRYMEMALYEPGLGYYSAGAHKLGAGGDFTTSPELTPLFGATLVSSLLPVLQGLKNNGLPARILEFGAGSGKLAESILTQLNKLNFKLDDYDFIEVSPDLAERQQKRIRKVSDDLHLDTAYQWLNTLPDHFQGVILANEVLDAIPCDAIIYQQGLWHWRGVGLDNNNFAWKIGGAVDPEILPEFLLNSNSFTENYVTELHTQSSSWIQSIARHMETGLFLTFDYGFPEAEYYHPQRHEGTILAHHRHHVIHDPFYLPGLCDITAHIEWTRIAEMALSEGADDVYMSNQANYLLDAGIGDLTLEISDPSDAKTYLPISNALQKLLSEAEMGELFKVFAFSKNIERILPAEHFLDSLPGLRGRNRL